VIPGDFVVDGECVGDFLDAFDLLEVTLYDLRRESYQQRYLKLGNLLARDMQRNIILAETAFAPGP
jgi:hypothetical protein